MLLLQCLAMNQPNMTGKVCLVTGANAGIGKATATGLARMGATVVMVCRSRERGETAQAEIAADSGSQDIDLLIADLSSQGSVRKLARTFSSTYSQLHVLINNAGTITHRRRITVDGIETQFAVNHLAPFLLTNLLLDTLKVSAPCPRRHCIVPGSQQESARFRRPQIRPRVHSQPGLPKDQARQHPLHLRARPPVGGN